MYAKYIPHSNKLLFIFCLHNLAAIVLLIFEYKMKCIQNFVKMWDKFCIHFVYSVYICCIHLVQFLHTKCIHDLCDFLFDW